MLSSISCYSHSNWQALRSTLYRSKNTLSLSGRVGVLIGICFAYTCHRACIRQNGNTLQSNWPLQLTTHIVACIGCPVYAASGKVMLCRLGCIFASAQGSGTSYMYLTCCTATPKAQGPAVPGKLKESCGLHHEFVLTRTRKTCKEAKSTTRAVAE
jgi:hypothetical protein